MLYEMLVTFLCFFIIILILHNEFFNPVVWPKYYTEFKLCPEYCDIILQTPNLEEYKKYPKLKPYIKSLEDTFLIQSIKNIFCLNGLDMENSIKETLEWLVNYSNKQLSLIISDHLYEKKFTENILIKKNIYIKEYVDEEILYKRNSFYFYFNKISTSFKFGWNYKEIERKPKSTAVLFLKQIHVLYSTFQSCMKNYNTVSEVASDKRTALDKCLFKIFSEVNSEDDFINIVKIEYEVVGLNPKYTSSPKNYLDLDVQHVKYAATVYYKVIDAENIDEKDLAKHFYSSFNEKGSDNFDKSYTRKIRNTSSC